MLVSADLMYFAAFNLGCLMAWAVIKGLEK